MAKKPQPIPRKEAQSMAAAVASGKRPTSPPPPKRKPRAKKPVEPLTDELQIIKPVPEEIISFNAGQILSGGFLRKRLSLNGMVETYSLEPILIEPPPKPVAPIVDTTDYGTPVAFPSWLATALKALSLLVLGSLGGIWAAGGIDVSPGPGPSPQDAVSAVFDTQEAAFRKYSGERAVKLRAGEFANETQSKIWMDENFIPKADAAWVKLLEAEKAEFGGEQWTAEKEAATIERYVR